MSGKHVWFPATETPAPHAPAGHKEHAPRETPSAVYAGGGRVGLQTSERSACARPVPDDGIERGPVDDDQ